MPSALGLLLAAAVFAAGCGGDETAAEATVTETVTETVTVTESAGAAAAKCGAEVDAFFAQLREIRTRSSVGMTYDDYVAKIGDAAVVRDSIPDTLTTECTGAVEAAELAFISYQRAGNHWTNCVRGGSCGDPRVRRTYQTLMTNARARLERAEAKLDQI